jgi:uncharacterized repeat protein (TIGR02543 family)
MKTVKQTVLTGIIFFLLVSCDNFIHELILPNDNLITSFKIDGQKGITVIGENTIAIPWFEGMDLDGPVSYEVSVSPKASLLPVTNEYIEAAFPDADSFEVIERINTATDTELTVFLEGLIRQTQNFNMPSLTIPINFSQSVTLLVISGRDGTIRQYTTHLTVSVKFVSNGGRPVPPNQAVGRGDTATRPDNQSRIGYIFDNWYSNEYFTEVYDFDTPVTEDITLYAKWSPITYTVRYDKNSPDATGTTVDSSHTYDVAKNLSPNGFTLADLIFAGWARTPGGAVEFTDQYPVLNLSSNDGDTVTLYAKWTTLNKQYTVTFNRNGATSGTAPGPITVDAGSSITIPGQNYLLRTGYTFGGWNTKADGTGTLYRPGDSFTPTGDTILYAMWTTLSKQQYTVTFDRNGATSGTAPGPITVDAGSSITIPGQNNLLRTDYTFGGWNTKADGTGTLYRPGDSFTPTGDTILYAMWIYDNPVDPPGILITIVVIENAPSINGLTISRSGSNGLPKTAKITVDNPQYSSITWYIDGTISVSEEPNSITLNAANTAYNSIGPHELKIEVVKNGVPDSRNITFYVVP